MLLLFPPLIGSNHNSHFVSSSTGMHYLRVAIPPAVMPSLIKKVDVGSLSLTCTVVIVLLYFLKVVDCEASP